jgi:spermidine synthase
MRFAKALVASGKTESSLSDAAPGVRAGTLVDDHHRSLSALFFASGFPALIYQLVWQRALFRIFGVNIESVTIIVTAFMLGLGIGSLFGGWLSKQRLPLMLVLAAIEASTGLFGIVSLRVFEAVGTLALGMPLGATALVALALVAIPTFLMGATLPVLVGHMIRRSGNVGGSVGNLYYVNTLGAGAACLVAAALIFPLSGMQTAIHIAVALNAAVATGALVAYRREPRAWQAATPMARIDAPAPKPLMRFAPVAALGFAGGFIALSYEIFFFRTISFADGGAATCSTLTLGAFLVGIASGSRKAALWCQGSDGGNACAGPAQLATNLIVANVIGFLFLPLLKHVSFIGYGMIGFAMALVYLLARLWGALLPCLAHFGVAPDERAGARTALLYFANILGSASGSIITGFVLMDRLSITQTATTLVAIGLACTLLLIAALPMPRGIKTRHAALATGCGAVAMVALPTLASGVLESMLWKGMSGDKPAFTHVVENRSGIIAVDEKETVWGNGMYDGRFSVDLLHDTNGIIRPFALSLFHAHPRDVLMVGLSSASWAQVIANNPEVESLTVVEINPGYLELIAKMPEVKSVLSNPKVHIITDDGRRWLRLNAGRRFDAIVTNTTWYFRSNSSNLLSTEYLALTREHLKPDGVYMYNSTGSERVQRTACSAFPYGSRFANQMIVSPAPLKWNFPRWRASLEGYRIDGRPVIDTSTAEGRARMDEMMALQSNVEDTSGDTAAHVIEPCERIMARTQGRMLVTDDNMGSEWRHPFGRE